MVPTRRRLSAQGIKCPTASLGSPSTLQELRNRITNAYASMSPDMLYNVQQEEQFRVQMYIVDEGHHFEYDR